MAIEALNIEFFDDNSDAIIASTRINPGDQTVNDFLPDTKIMTHIPQQAFIGGLLIDNPQNVYATLYESLEDDKGIPQTDKNIIIIKPGQEVNIQSVVEDKEVWFVFDSNESKIIPLEPELTGAIT